nr:methylmalonyl-CoA mutase family protein [Hyphomicrobium zavarzinii]
MTAANPAQGVSATPLASDFEAATREQWLALVDKAIKGADFEKKLVTRTADGIRVEPIYVRSNGVPELQAAIPGQAPFTRGAASTVRGLGWEIRQRISALDPARANTQILTELEGGSNGILVDVEAPGQTGCRIKSAADMTTLLSGMRLDLAPVELNAGLGAPDAARHLLASLSGLGIPAQSAQVLFGLDPIGSLARWGALPVSVEQALADAIALAREAAAKAPLSRTVRVDATIYHEAGATEAYELAALGATLIAYLRAFEAAGVSPSDALKQISFAVSADTDLFATVAKLRAARLLWAALRREFGLPESPVHIHAETSRRMLTVNDFQTNIVRSTIAAFAAGVGGADSVVVLPHSFPLGGSDDDARRIARNVQSIVLEETNAYRVADPAAGAGAIEALTDALAEKAWEAFREIEAEGGMLAALRSGFWQARVGETRASRDKLVASRKVPLVGVSEFPKADEARGEIRPAERPAPSRAAP